MKIFYYVDHRGNNPVKEFLRSLNVKEMAKCYSYIDLLREHGNSLSSQYIERDGDLYQLRPEFGNVEFRIFYFTLHEGEIYLLHAFKKKSNKTPSSEKQIAQERMSEIKKEK